jgi:plasmid stabilization system protein ParE
MKYKLTITERAEELLDHILYYIINQLKNPQAAVNLIAEIELVYGNLENNPKMYAYSDDTFLKSRGYQKA